MILITACKDFHYQNNYTIKLIHLFHEKLNDYFKLKEKINMIYIRGMKANIYDITKINMKNNIYKVGVLEHRATNFMLHKTCIPYNLFNNNRIEVLSLGVKVDNIKY